MEYHRKNELERKMASSKKHFAILIVSISRREGKNASQLNGILKPVQRHFGTTHIANTKIGSER